MSNISYVTMTDDSRAAEVLEMMRLFYLEVDADPNVDSAWFPKTIRFLLNHPDHGRVILMLDGQKLSGYALIINFWSNEYGGALLLIDELYVAPAARRTGLARGFFEMLKREPPWNARMMMLEVGHHNARAQRLYESIGFKDKGNSLMTLRV